MSELIPSIPELAISDELMSHWIYLATTPGPLRGTSSISSKIIAELAAGWGWGMRAPQIQAAADEEFAACVTLLRDMALPYDIINRFRAARRPKYSLRKQALAALKTSHPISTADGSVTISQQALTLAIAALEEGHHD